MYVRRYTTVTRKKSFCETARDRASPNDWQRYVKRASRNENNIHRTDDDLDAARSPSG